MKKYILMFGLTLVMGLFISSDLIAQEWNTVGNNIHNTNSGNVGIGYTSPAQKLDVNGRIAMGVGGRLYARRSDGTTVQEMFTLDGNNDIFMNRQALTAVGGGGQITGVGIAIGAGKNFTLRNSGNEFIMRVNEATNNVLIGYNSPLPASVKLAINGPVAIGSNSALPAGVKLSVTDGDFILDGKMTSKEIEVKLDVWSDFVFYDDYYLRPLDEVEQFIKTNRHLPDVPSEAEVLENGVNVGQMSAVLLQKIEELTLYIIELNKRIEELEK